jgi:hypothetical protein
MRHARGSHPRASGFPNLRQATDATAWRRCDPHDTDSNAVKGSPARTLVRNKRGQEIGCHARPASASVSTKTREPFRFLEIRNHQMTTRKSGAMLARLRRACPRKRENRSDSWKLFLMQNSAVRDSPAPQTPPPTCSPKPGEHATQCDLREPVAGVSARDSVPQRGPTWGPNHHRLNATSSHSHTALVHLIMIAPADPSDPLLTLE